MATPSPVNFFKHVKHCTHNIQNDCHQWLSGSFRVHQIRFRPGLHPGPTGGAYSALRDPLAGLRGVLIRGRERGMEKGKGEEGKGGNRGAPPFRKFLDPPLSSTR